MNQDQIDSLVRTALKIVAGAVIAHGGSQVLAGAINTPDVAELVTGIIMAILSAYASHKSNGVQPSTPAQPSKPIPPVVSAILLTIVSIVFVTGCAYTKSNTYSKTTIGTNGVPIVEQYTHARAFTFFDAQSQLAKFRNGSSTTQWGTNTISPGTWASGLNESSSSSNLVAGAAQITAAGVAAFVQSAK